jgi:hypothetical protein
MRYAILILVMLTGCRRRDQVTPLPTPIPVDGTANRLTVFADVIVQRINDQTKKIHANDPKDFDITDTAVLGQVDLQKADSILHPVVGVITVKEFYWSVGREDPTIAGGHQSTLTIKIAPDGAKWKCVSAERRIDEDRPFARKSEAGRTIDVTEYFRGLVEN